MIALREEQRDGLLLVAALSAVMWIAEIADRAASLNLDANGIEPRSADGLAGIVVAPFLHNGFGHLISNTPPFLVLGGLIALAGAMRVVAVTAIVAVVAGLGTWLIAPSHTVTIGASGVVFGYASYLVARAALSRRLTELAVALLVLALWGTTLLAGILVPGRGVSWQDHLFGAIGGVLAARTLSGPARTEQKTSALTEAAG